MALSRFCLTFLLLAAASRGSAVAQELVRPELMSRPGLNDYLKANYNLDLTRPVQAEAFDRVMAKTGLAAREFKDDQEPLALVKRIQQSLIPVAEGAAARARTLDDEAPSEETQGRIRDLAPELLDLSAMAVLLDPAHQRQVVVSNHWAQAMLLQAGKEGASRELESDVLRALSADVRKPDDEELSPLSQSLIHSHRPFSALESADPGLAHRHFLSIAETHGAPAIVPWFNFLEVSGIANGDAVNAGKAPIAFPLLESASRSYLEADDEQREHWRLNDRQSFRQLQSEPEKAHLDLLSLRLLAAAGGAAADWDALDRLLAAVIKARNSNDHLRHALSLLYARLVGKIPDALWTRFLAQPPRTREERRSFGAVAHLFVNTQSSDELRSVLKSHAEAPRQDYPALHRDIMAMLYSGLGKKLELTEEQEARIVDGGRAAAILQENGLLNALLTLSTFQAKTGLESLRRLLIELSGSASGGRLRYKLRYNALKGRLPDEMLVRWIKNYVQTIGAEAPPGAQAGWSSAGEKLQASLGVAAPSELSRFAAPAKASAERWRREYRQRYGNRRDDALLNRLGGEFLPKLQEILEQLKADRSPSREALLSVLPILGKQQWLEGVLPNPAETLSVVGGLRLSLDPERSVGQKTPSDLEILSVTDDPAQMIQMGDEPYKGCLTRTNATSNNMHGQLVNRLLLGQFKLANWTQGGELVARTLLEIGRDRYGRPALLVERLYVKPGLDPDKERLRNSLAEYARHLDVATIYYPGKDGVTNEKWGEIEGGEPKTPYELFDEQGLTLRRDSIGEDWTRDIDPNGARKANGAVAVYLKPKPPESRLHRLWRRLRHPLTWNKQAAA